MQRELGNTTRSANTLLGSNSLPGRKTLLSPVSQHCHKPPHHQLHTEEISHVAGRPPDFLSQQSQGIGLLLSSLPHPHNTIMLQNALSRRGTPILSTGCEMRKGCGLAGGGAATYASDCCALQVVPGCAPSTWDLAVSIQPTFHFSFPFSGQNTAFSTGHGCEG